MTAPGMLGAPATGYPDTFYSRTTDGRAPRPPAEGQAAAEIAVIGGGLAGLTVARELAAAGRSVALLESATVAFGASGRNGGFCTPGWAVGHDALVRMAGTADADALYRLSVEGVDYVRARAEAAGDPSIGLRPGVMSARRTPGGDLAREAAELTGRYGYAAEYVPPQRMRELCLTRKYIDGLRSDRGFTLHPLNYARALAREAEALGARIFEGTPATALTRAGIGSGEGRWRIATPRATIAADQVVIATGGYTGKLEPRLRRAYVPVATYVMASERNPELLASAIRTGDGIGDERRAGDYYRLIEGGARLLWGGAITVRDRSPAQVAAYLRRGMLETYPQLEPLRFDIAWSGWMSYARHKMAQVGRLGNDGPWYCTAFGGHGVNTTAAAGRAVARAILGTSDEIALFRHFGLDWTGGIAGRAAAQSTYWYLQWRDARAEARVAASAPPAPSPPAPPPTPPAETPGGGAR